MQLWVSLRPLSKYARQNLQYNDVVDATSAVFTGSQVICSTTLIFSTTSFAPQGLSSLEQRAAALQAVLSCCVRLQRSDIAADAVRHAVATAGNIICAGDAEAADAW